MSLKLKKLRDVEDCGDHVRTHLETLSQSKEQYIWQSTRNTPREWLRWHILENNPNKYQILYAKNFQGVNVKIRHAHGVKEGEERAGNKVDNVVLLRLLRATELYYLCYKLGFKEKEIMKLMDWRTRIMTNIYAKALGDPDLEKNTY